MTQAKSHGTRGGKPKVAILPAVEPTSPPTASGLGISWLRLLLRNLGSVYFSPLALPFHTKANDLPLLRDSSSHNFHLTSKTFSLRDYCTFDDDLSLPLTLVLDKLG